MSDVPAAPAVGPSPEVDAVSAIMSAGYFAVSADGLVRAVATGDQRLSSVEFADVAGTDIAEVSQSVTEAVRAALGTAQRETLAALQSVPGIGDHIPREEGSADA